MAVRRMSSNSTGEKFVQKLSSPRRRGSDAIPQITGKHRNSRGAMPAAHKSSKNDYRCVIEINQNGRYTVRIRAAFGRSGWMLPLYFVASSFDGAMKKLEESLQFLQRQEESLWFWGVERSDDPKLAGDLLQGLGLHLDRRGEFPQRFAGLGVQRERAVPAVMLAPFRRALAESVIESRSALASD
jgi:hypothetical protein